MSKGRKRRENQDVCFFPVSFFVFFYDFYFSLQHLCTLQSNGVHIFKRKRKRRMNAGHSDNDVIIGFFKIETVYSIRMNAFSGVGMGIKLSKVIFQTYLLHNSHSPR